MANTATPKGGSHTGETGNQRDRTDRHARVDGAILVAAAAAFFLGSGVLTQSGQPGASTPVPWMVSHVSWIAATALVAVGTIRLARRVRASWSAASVASGAFGLGTLHATQWATWVYVDIVAYRRGAHELLLEPLLHPFGVGHMLMYGILVGSGVAAIAWTLRNAAVTHSLVDWTGVAVGTLTVLTATVALVTVQAVRSPLGLATIGLIAVVFAWLGALGVDLYRAS